VSERTEASSIKELETIAERLVGAETGPFTLFDPSGQFDETRSDPVGIAAALNAAFLITMAGEGREEFAVADDFLKRMAQSGDWSRVAQFYRDGRRRIRQEIEETCRESPGFAERLRHLSAWLSDETKAAKAEQTTSHIWSVFFPEAVGLREQWQQQVERLRAKRTLVITRANPDPVQDPAREILFTSNALLTVPHASQSIDALPYSDAVKDTLRTAAREPQLYWYDHPIQIGVAPEKNEILHGLFGLDEAVGFERERGNIEEGVRISCALSVSVTHKGLHKIARQYIEEELARTGGLKNIDIYVFTEADTDRMVEEVLAPAASRLLGVGDALEQLDMFGVDGTYGRHYSFLKAVAPLWHVLVDERIIATFKIDLDQVFPQQELVEQSGASAFEHLLTPLWGDEGTDDAGRPVELGLIAGALVNQSEIGKGLFTPDILPPDRELAADEHIFFSALPQALSTEAEMMTRYDAPPLDGKIRCIQRIHVTGGTVGVLVDSLRRHRLFAPSFFGRAEDQSYILSDILNLDSRPVYVHEPGLIMRHDKHAFAQEAIETAYVGKLLGDYVRILYFTAYAKVLAGDVRTVKAHVDPFTGCFISQIPVTVVFLRFALKAATFFDSGKTDRGLEFVTTGAERISQALEFAGGADCELGRAYHRERSGWDVFYDTLDALERGVADNHEFAKSLREKARKIVSDCTFSGP
jgi:hypothetical protein